MALAIVAVRQIGAHNWYSDTTFVDEGQKTYDKFRNLMHKIGDMKITKQVGIDE